MRHWMSMALLILAVPAHAESYDPKALPPIDRSCSEKYSSGDFVGAVTSCRDAALRGSKDAQTYLGIMYFFGQGVVTDNQKAAQWFQKAANQNQPKAQFYLGKMYSAGLGVNQDETLAIQWFKASAEQGFWEAQWMMSMAYRLGLGVPQDMGAAFLWYQAAIKNGFKDAPEKTQNDFGFNFYKMDPKTPGFAEYKQGIDALIGVEGDPDPSRAADFFLKAADQGHPDAAFKLGMLYFDGDGIGQNYSESFSWFSKAAESEHREAQAYLAWMTSLGLGAPIDTNTATELYVKSLEPTLAQQAAQRPPEIKEGSFAWYQEAAKKGDPKAQTYVAKKYIEGDEVRQNYREAVLWLDRAARSKYPPAQYQLALLLIEGKGVIQNPQQALYWLNQAALANEPHAQFELGLHFLEGKYVKQNLQQAYVWLNLADGQELVEAQAAKTLAMEAMSPSELEQAEVMSREMYQKLNP